MHCKHCGTNYHDNNWAETGGPVQRGDGAWRAQFSDCSKCDQTHVRVFRGNTLAYQLPIGDVRTAHPIVPDHIASLFNEAAAVLDLSAKASAALSRTCLQTTLREKGQVKAGSLSSEIDQILKSGNLPPALADSIDAIRVIGNFSAHPIKSQTTGSIVDVEPGEAEWLLDVLEGLFDHLYVLPANIEKKRDAINIKLRDAGKPELKSSSAPHDE